MTTTEAAGIIGCSVSHVRTLIRQGKLRANQRSSLVAGCGFVYEVNVHDVRKYSKKPQGSGYPRGVPREREA